MVWLFGTALCHSGFDSKDDTCETSSSRDVKHIFWSQPFLFLTMHHMCMLRTASDLALWSQQTPLHPTWIATCPLRTQKLFCWDDIFRAFPHWVFNFCSSIDRGMLHDGSTSTYLDIQCFGIKKWKKLTCKLVLFMLRWKMSRHLTDITPPIHCFVQESINTIHSFCWRKGGW